VVRHSTRRPDDASALVAPTACRPATTRANDDANPLIDATTPDEMGWKMGYRPFVAQRFDNLSERELANAGSG
jgi:hypothetical protein